MGSSTPSTLVGAKASQTHYYAEEQARRLGYPLTHYVTINFASTKLDPRDAVPCFSELRRSDFNKWATRPGRRGGPAVVPTYAYSFENARGDFAFQEMGPGDPHNVHVNWLVHIPPARVHDFEQQLWGWVGARTGGITGGGEAICIRAITTTVGGYLIKGAHPSALKLYGRGQKHVPQGIIIGRRAATSRNLGPMARRATDKELGVRRRVPSIRPRPQPEVRPTS